MQLGRRLERGRQVRVINWDANSSSDLSTIVMFTAVSVICPVAIVGAARTTRWVRDLFVVVAVLSGLVWILLAGMLVVIAVVVSAVRARRVTGPAQALMAFVIACLGGAAGLQTYESGPAALVIGPVVAVIVVALVWPRLSTRTARTRAVALAALGALVSVAVGATVFL